MLVGVEPAGPTVGVAEGHLRTVGHRQRLSLNDGAQTAFQGRLERAGHHQVWSLTQSYSVSFLESGIIVKQWGFFTNTLSRFESLVVNSVLRPSHLQSFASVPLYLCSSGNNVRDEV